MTKLRKQIAPPPPPDPTKDPGLAMRSVDLGFMLPKERYRIVTNGYMFQVQRRFLWWWSDVIEERYGTQELAENAITVLLSREGPWREVEL